MCKEIVKKIYHLSKKEGINQVKIMTNHLKFCGTLQEENHGIDDEILNLTDVKIWRINDICTCKDPECKCNDDNFLSVDYIHINVSKIVAFTLKK